MIKTGLIIDAASVIQKMVTSSAIAAKGAEAAFDEKVAELKQLFMSMQAGEPAVVGGGNFRLVLTRDDVIPPPVPAGIIPDRPAPVRRTSKK